MSLIYIIDDDVSLCQALKFLFESIQLSPRIFNNGQEFLDKYDPNLPACILMDVRMPNISGLDVLTQLKKLNGIFIAIMITSYSDAQIAVRALKKGAADFIIKPFNNQDLIEIVQKSISKLKIKIKNQSISRKIMHLTKREKEVLNLLIEGKLNKEMAFLLNVSISTIEAHRAKIMKKINVKTVAELVRVYMESINSNDGSHNLISPE